MKFIIKIFFPIISIILFSLLIYTYYKSEIVWDGIRRDHYLKYFIVIFILIFFSILITFINQKIKKYLIVFALSILLGLYLFEFYYLYNNKINLLKNKNFYLKSPPLKKNFHFIHLSYEPFKKILGGNDNGYFVYFLSDEEGFKNPNNEWHKNDLEYVLIGDSFAEGSNVFTKDDIASNLRDVHNSSTLNLGLSGNGPLLELAILKEYIYKKPKKIIWLYFEGNDLSDLDRESKDSILMRYLDKNFLFNVSKNNIYPKSKSILYAYTTLFFTRKIVSGILSKKNKKKFSKNFNLFKEIISLANTIAIENHSKLYFVYLPEYDRYKMNYDNSDYDLIRKIIKELDIPFIDIHTEVFKKQKNPLKLFPFEMNGHYTAEGYKKIAQTINKFTKN